MKDHIERDHRFRDYPNDPKPESVFRCRRCGHLTTALEQQSAKYNYPCAGCGSEVGFIGTEEVTP